MLIVRMACWGVGMERADVGHARIGRRDVLVGAAALGMGALVAGCTSAPAPRCSTAITAWATSS